MKRGTPEHPKMKRLARALDINRAWAVGLLESLWHWASKFSPQGDIGKHDDIDIADGCFWNGEPSKLISSLISCGWIDEDNHHRLLIHDWHHHCDESVRKLLNRSKLPFLTCRDAVETLSRQIPDMSAEIIPGEAQAMAKAQEGECEGKPDRAPTREQALKWRTTVVALGADYTEFETVSAWLALNSNGWMWGRNPVTDWRSALERQIQTDRQKNEKHSANNKPTPSQLRNATIIGAERAGADALATVERRERHAREAQAAKDALAAQVVGHGSASS